MRVLKLSGQVVALAAVAGLLGLLVWRVTHRTAPPKIGGPAPTFKLERVDKPGTVDLASLRGKPVVLNFWASWCDTCTHEAPLIEQAQRSLAASGMGTVIGIDYKDISSYAQQFIDQVVRLKATRTEQ